MENITLGPFSFIIASDKLNKPKEIIKTIEKYINENTKIKNGDIPIIKYNIIPLSLTPSHQIKEFNYNFEIIVKSTDTSERYKALKGLSNDQDSAALEINKISDDNTEIVNPPSINNQRILNRQRIINSQIIINIMIQPPKDYLTTEVKVMFYIFDNRDESKLNMYDFISRFGNDSEYFTNPFTSKPNPNLKLDTYNSTFNIIENITYKTDVKDIYKNLNDKKLLIPCTPLVIVCDTKDFAEKFLDDSRIDYSRINLLDSLDIIEMIVTVNGEDIKRYFKPNTLGGIQYDSMKFGPSNPLEDGTYYIYIVLSRNALHDDPFKLVSDSKLSALDIEKGNHDSPLSILGMLQAVSRGKKLYNYISLHSETADKKPIICTSALNRSQTTGLLMYYSDDIIKEPEEDGDDIIEEVEEDGYDIIKLFPKETDLKDIDLKTSFITLMKHLMADEYDESYFIKFLQSTNISDLRTACEYSLSSLNDYKNKFENDKFKSLTCYFIHCSIGRMMYLCWQNHKYKDMSVDEIFGQLNKSYQDNAFLKDGPILPIRNIVLAKKKQVSTKKIYDAAILHVIEAQNALTEAQNRSDADVAVRAAVAERTKILQEAAFDQSKAAENLLGAAQKVSLATRDAAIAVGKVITLTRDTRKSSPAKAGDVHIITVRSVNKHNKLKQSADKLYTQASNISETEIKRYKLISLSENTITTAQQQNITNLNTRITNIRKRYNAENLIYEQLVEDISNINEHLSAI
jgi:hypothetical protein